MKTKKKSALYYNLTSGTYDCQYREEQISKYSAALELIRITTQDSILDLGCGTGLFINQIAGLGNSIVGIDVSKKMVKEAKQKRPHPRIFLLCADADHLPFRDRVFDQIFSFTLLQHMPDPKKTIMELRRVAKENSEAVLTVPKKAVPLSSFRNYLKEKNLVVTGFIDIEELKDYIAVCRVR